MSTEPEDAKSEADRAQRSLFFSGGQPIDGSALRFRGTSSEIETDELSDSVWERIQSGEIIKHLPRYLSRTDAINMLSIEPNGENRCNMMDNGVHTVTISRNEGNGSLGFIVDTSKKGGSIDPIRLMIATAKCASILAAKPQSHFTISACASAKDVALMLLEMRRKPPFEATLSPNVIATVQQEMGKLSLEHQKIIREQLLKQNPPSPSATRSPGL